jgi:rfaE bifunctional protein kinase chain/domain/rfaE bifunctional protein nucleotidyltransferase chain/domain
MKVVFTNGCFDVLHPGHVDLLERARGLGDRLVVGLNSDASVRALKGPGRPLVPQEERALMLRALRSVDEVIIFDETTPERLIGELSPDVLVKGGDWPIDRIIGAEAVLRRGGQVISLPFRLPYSTTGLIERIATPSHPFPAAAVPPGSPGPSILDSFHGRKVLVLGDIMLDRYWFGTVHRISPEAPVPVIKKCGDTPAPGGAANVAANIASLGGIPVLVGTIGGDDAGRELKGILEKRGIDLEHLFVERDRPTTIKTRIIAHNQQVVRVDEEETSPAGPSVLGRITETVRALLPSVDLLVISDYGKGLVLPDLAAQVIRMAREVGPRVVVDSKAADYSPFKGAYLLTPNRTEAARAAGVSPGRSDSLAASGALLLENLGVEAVIITRSEEGMTLFEPGREPVNFPTRARTVYDVTGAGDTVVATIGLALAAGASLAVTAELANLAGGIAVERFGTSAVTEDQLRRALREGRLWEGPAPEAVYVRDVLSPKTNA